MKLPSLPSNESDWLKALHSYKILDTLSEPAFDKLTALAAYIGNAPIALFNLVDTERLWIKSKVGLAATEVCRDWAFCSHAILEPSEPLIIPDTLLDERFATNPLVTSQPNIRYYAGFPIVTSAGYALGTLCLLDRVPRQLQPQQLEALQTLSHQVGAQLQLRLKVLQLANSNQLLQRSEKRFRFLVEGVKDYGIFMLSTDGRVASWNAGAENIKGYPAAQILGRHFSCFYPAEDIAAGKPEQGLKNAASYGRFESEGWRLRQDGSKYWANVVLTAFHNSNGQLQGFVKVTRDLTERKQTEEALVRARIAEATNQKLNQEISERKRVEAQLLHNAFHDALTGLPNRALLLEQLRRALLRAKQHSEFCFAVLFLDLDRFKLVNDSLGHMVGDELLLDITQRLSSCLSSNDMIARLGGDEFVILLEDVQNLSNATDMAERLQSELASPFHLGGQETFISTSIGILPSWGTSSENYSYERPEEMLRDADIAMYRAKAQAKSGSGGQVKIGYEVFDTAMHVQVMARLQLESDLRRAVERQEFHLYYQPIVLLATGRITGFEALIRWQHPELGLISPATFIPIAEETGLIIPIGNWVLEQACQQLSLWQTQFPLNPPLTVSVNLSVKQFVQPDLIGNILQILYKHRLAPGSLKLEITESVLIENAEVVTPALSLLKALGVGLCLDDFGTGYSSLSYLHRFPIDILKIDRSFVNQMSFGDKNFKIVQAIITLAQSLDIEVVAEGIETLDQQTLLSALPCRYGQGYLFSQPLTTQAASAFLTEQFKTIESFSS